MGIFLSGLPRFNTGKFLIKMTYLASKVYCLLSVLDNRQYTSEARYVIYTFQYLYRLQAVPFWIVERSREIAEREKKKVISPRSSLAAL